MRFLRWVGLATWLLACRDPGGGDSPETTPGGRNTCGSACVEGEPCVLDPEDDCTFAEPTSWFLIDALVGETRIDDPNVMSELLAFPASLAGVVEPVPLSAGAFDSEYWISFFQYWSPDGKLLVFDASNGFEDAGFDSRFFVSEFGDGLPTAARRIENLPGGVLLGGQWDPSSEVLTLQHDTGVYALRHTTDGMTATLALSSGDDDFHEYSLCERGEAIVYSGSSGLGIGPIDRALGELEICALCSGAVVSPDGRKLAFVRHDPASEQYSVELGACARGTARDVVLTVDAEPNLWFSEDSARLLIERAEGDTSFVEAEDPGAGTRPAEPPRETPTLPEADDAAWEWAGDWAIRRRFDPESASIVGLAVFRSEDLERPLFDVEVRNGQELTSFTFSPDDRYFACIVSGSLEANVLVANLAAPETGTRSFQFPNTVDLILGDFAGDGSGMLAGTLGPRFQVFFLSFEGWSESEPVPVLVHEASAGDFLSAQPWP